MEATIATPGFSKTIEHLCMSAVKEGTREKVCTMWKLEIDEKTRRCLTKLKGT